MTAKINGHFLNEVPGNGGNIREGLVGLPRTINPVLAITDVDRDMSALVYSGLMKYSDGDLMPDLAEKYAVSADGLTYSFTLKNSLTFQDGSPLTTDDVAFTIQKIQDPALKSPRRADWANVGVKIISATQIQFILKQAYSPFLNNTTLGIIPKHIWNSVSDDQFIFSKYNSEPIGSGPYKVSSIARDNGNIPTAYHMTTWRGYYGTTPHLGAITFTFFADEEKALSALDTGNIDSLAAVSSTAATKLASDSAQAYAVLSAPLPRIFGVFFNQSQNPVLADKNVRQALDMSIDRTAIIKKVLSGYGSPIHSPLPIGMGATLQDASHPDIAGAQTLLEKNGWKKDPTSGIYQKKGTKSSLSLSITINTADTPDLKQAAELVKNDWKKLGADVNVKVFEPGDLYQNVIRTRKYEALLFGELVGKDRDVYAFWHSSQRNSPGLNIALYANSKADKLLDEIRSESNDAVRTGKYTELSKLITADIPAIFLYSPDFIYVVPKALHGAELGNITVSSDRWNSIGNWYVITEKVWKIFSNAKN